ncbi:MAG: hypothetical protein GY862_13350, partial [Gammaproteobacteria bacterium]|nr:hypothetical protein [Gammaproteobacteria bacterium]
MVNTIIQQTAPISGATGTPKQATITPFAFDSLALRTLIDKSGNTWFVAKDVCACLELNNVSEAVNRLDEDERGDIITNDVTNRSQKLLTVNESGLYSLIFTSRKPEARAFKRWVTHEVLPAIRKTGAYGVEAERISSLEQRLERLEGQPRKTRQARREEFPGLHENFPDIRRLTNYRCQILRLADADQGASTGEI